jgi:hypothetical protein
MIRLLLGCTLLGWVLGVAVLYFGLSFQDGPEFPY